MSGWWWGERTAALQKTPGGILVVSQTSFRSFPSAFSPDAIAGWSLYPYALRGHNHPPPPSVRPKRVGGCSTV